MLVIVDSITSKFLFLQISTNLTEKSIPLNFSYGRYNIFLPLPHPTSNNNDSEEKLSKNLLTQGQTLTLDVSNRVAISLYISLVCLLYSINYY